MLVTWATECWLSQGYVFVTNLLFLFITHSFGTSVSSMSRCQPDKEGLYHAMVHCHAAADLASLYY